MKLYAISYDDQKVLAEFSRKQGIPYPLLSDVDSEVIRAYGILNDRVEPGDAFLYGIPFPGSYVTDEDGVVIAKFFHDSYKKRDSPEALLDAALGRIVLGDDSPRVEGGGEEVRVTAAIHGGKGSIRQGILRKLVVRFELEEGRHLYGSPTPDGMIPTSVRVQGPPGLVVEEPIFPPTRPLHLEAMDVTLQIWSGSFDVVVPFYAVGELASEVRPLDQDVATLEVSVRYQVCDDRHCLLPRSEKLSLQLPLDVVDVPALSMHRGHGQREGRFNARPHLLRLFLRKVGGHPLGFLRFLGKTLKLELAARRRGA